MKKEKISFWEIFLKGKLCEEVRLHLCSVDFEKEWGSYGFEFCIRFYPKC